MFNRLFGGLHASHRRPRFGRQSGVSAPDRIGIVGFHDRGFVIARPTEPHSHWLQQRSQTLKTKIGGSGTNMTDGLRKALDLLRSSPTGMLRRIWLLSDGYPNVEEGAILPVVQQARNLHVNINTIGFGNNLDAGLLQRIASTTHNGKFITVASLHQLTTALAASGRSTARPHHRRSETTIFTVDLSPSMTGDMGGRRRIDAVEQALLELLLYKQKCFS